MSSQLSLSNLFMRLDHVLIEKIFLAWKNLHVVVHRAGPADFIDQLAVFFLFLLSGVVTFQT